MTFLHIGYSYDARAMLVSHAKAKVKHVCVQLTFEAVIILSSQEEIKASRLYMHTAGKKHFPLYLRYSI